MMLLMLHCALSAGLMWTSWRRVVLCDHNTKWFVRWSYSALGTSGLISLMAPFAWHVQPQIFMVVVLAAILAVQLTSATLWRFGVPRSFQQPASLLRGRFFGRVTKRH